MHFLVKGRCTGKTTNLLHWLRANPSGVLIVATADDREGIRQVVSRATIYESLRADFDSRVFTFAEAARSGVGDRLVVIDDIDRIIESLLNVRVVTATATWGAS